MGQGSTARVLDFPVTATNPSGAGSPPAADFAVDGATLRQHLAQADIPTLLLTVAHLSGDLSLLRDEWRPTLALGVAMSGLTQAQEAEVRALCCERLVAFRDRGAPMPPRPTYDQFVRMATWLMGAVIAPWLPLVAEELVFAGDDPRAPGWTKEQVAPGRDFHVAIIGAGESGLVTAFRLKQAGVPFVIYEKNSEVGGTWLENHYPGCRVDINSFFYSYAFARRTWKEYFSTSQDVLAYMQEVARECGLYEHIRFGTEVTAARWDEQEALWRLTTRDASGTHAAQGNLVVFAVGQLNRPLLPDIPGQADFTGESFHSARWNHDADLAGKRIGVIGTGASAAQFIPQLARMGGDVSIFARTTNWLLPTPDLHDAVSDGARWLHDHLPGYSLWYRAAVVMPQTVGFLDDVVVDPDYPPTERAVSARNERLRELITAWMEPQFADRPDLRDVIIPDSPVGGKRIVRDNGTWIATLKRDNVHVIRDAIEAITPAGIRCADGTEHALDVIVYGTGFEASKFLMPVQVTGRDGRDLHDTWQDDARAYMGMTIPDFPNLFCMYGPNTNLVVYGSIILFSELTAKYIVDATRLLLEGGQRALEVRPEVFETFNERVDEANRLRAWGYSKVNSWYKNSKGRVAQNFPFDAVEFWKRTDHVVPAEYRFD